MAIEKIPENWYIGGPTYPSSFTKDRITLIQTVNYLTAKIQECIETINAVDPSQVNEFIALVNQLNEAVTQLTSEVNSATETANNASQTATSAKQTADGLADEITQANTTANEAKSTADSANTTAQGASSKADNAVTVASEANGKSDNAVQVANAATGSANEAKVAAQAAQNSSTSALSNASTALSTANQALTKSETAISSAETANDTANAAKTTAEEIASTAQSAVNTANEAKSTAEAASAKVDNFVPGHTIVNSSGGNLPTRNKLQFKGAVVSDNSGGDSTIVEIQSGVINSETVVSFEEGNVIVQSNGKAAGKTLTASDVGAATTEQGEKADSAVQPYKPGDSYTLTNFAFNGFLTNANKSIRFCIPLFKSVLASNATISGSGRVRQNGNYLFGSGTIDENFNTLSNVSCRIQEGFLTITLENNNGFGGTNNDTISFSGSVTITFS